MFSPSEGKKTLVNQITQLTGKGITVLSLFDGISCGMVALERAGIPVKKYYAYEIEPHAIQVSQKNYPDIIQCGSVVGADFKQYEGIDLLIGGSPCQSLSIVLKDRLHLGGKSKLFYEYVRALRQSKPKYFLFENVASMNDESKDIISELLGCEPYLINSSHFSAQERERYYWTNIPVNMLALPENNTVIKDIMEQDVADKYWYNRPLYDINPDKRVCATMDLKIIEMHKRIFNVNYKAPTLTCVSGGHQQKKIYINGRVRKMMPLEYERLQTLPDGYTDVGLADGHRYNCIGNGWTVDVIVFILQGTKLNNTKEGIK